jgi:hypothetical protein
VLDCTYYCSSIASVCSGNETQYESTATCMTMCGTINNDAGFGMTSGDTLSCRMYFLSLAAVTPSPAVMCAYAGPYGFGGCGTLCNDFCEHYFNSVCGGKPQNGYPSYTECTTYCAAAAGSDASAGDPGSVTTGAGMPCREYHLENAIGAGGTGGGHCAHAGEDGGGVCPP